MGEIEVFQVFEEFSLPTGKTFQCRKGYWIVRDDLQSVTCVHKGEKAEYSLERLNLSNETDVMENIGFLNESSFFLLIIRSKNPMLFIVPFDSQCEYSIVDLNCLYFHLNVRDVFSPYDGVFCVISKEGISLHSLKLDCLYSYNAKIMRSCHDGDLLCCGNRNALWIHQFARNGKSYQLLDTTTDNVGFPLKIIARGRSAYLFRIAGGSPSVVKLTFRAKGRMANHPNICDLHSSDACVYSIINRNNHFILYRKL